MNSTQIRGILLAVLLLVAAACDPPPRSSSVTATGCKVSDYGRGVYWFDCASDFGPALAEFRQSHEVLGITSYSSYNYGTTGYWVITK